MNRELQAVIRTMPSQYYWVHKRFKSRPEKVSLRCMPENKSKKWL